MNRFERTLLVIFVLYALWVLVGAPGRSRVTEGPCGQTFTRWLAP